MIFMKTILVLFGGCSSEHSVSLQSAHAVLAHLDLNKYHPLPVGITEDGRWLCCAGGFDGLLRGSWQAEGIPCALRLDRGQTALLLLDGSGNTLNFDAAFPVLHGKNGEDGTVQGLLELVGIPIIGCGTLSSALCMDKDRAHRLAEAAGVPVPRSAAVSAGASWEDVQAAAETLGYPLFVKPVRAGSSFGVSRVETPEALPAAVENAFRQDSRILLEEAVPGFEVGCAVMGNPGETALTVGAVDEIELSGGFFDFEEKYTLKTSSIHCPARISLKRAEEIQTAARKVYEALDCRCFARVDFFLTPEGGILFNEVNTIPGFTAHSRYPSMMKAAGLDFPALLDRLIELGAGA